MTVYAEFSDFLKSLDHIPTTNGTNALGELTIVPGSTVAISAILAKPSSTQLRSIEKMNISIAYSKIDMLLLYDRAYSITAEDTIADGNDQYRVIHVYDVLDPHTGATDHRKAILTLIT
jgi:hypothetical protein